MTPRVRMETTDHFAWLNAETRSRALTRTGSNLLSVNRVARGGKSHAPPSSFSNSSFIATKFRFSQKPSGLSRAGGMRSDLGPRSSPQVWTRRVTIEVPERCAPAMQATVRFCSVFVTGG